MIFGVCIPSHEKDSPKRRSCRHRKQVKPSDLEAWRGRTEQKLDDVCRAVSGEKGLVNTVSNIELRLAGYKAYMAMWAAAGTFLGTILSSIAVAVIVKYFLK